MKMGKQIGQIIGILFTCFLFIQPVYAQKTKENSLKLDVQRAKTEAQTTDAYLKLGDYYLKTDYEKLQTLLRQIPVKKGVFTSNDDIRMQLFLAKASKKMQNYSDFLIYMRRFENYDYSPLSLPIKADIERNLGFAALLRKNRDGVRLFYNSALITVKTIRDFSATTDILCYMAYEAMLYREKDRAISFSEEALDYARRSGKKSDLARCFNTQANIYSNFRQKEIAIRKNLLAFELAMQDNRYFEMSTYSIEIGQMQEQIQNLSGAKYYYELALENAKSIRAKNQMGYVFTLLADVLRKEGDLKASQKLNFQALKWINPKTDPIRIGTVERNIALNYIDLKAASQAMLHLRKALRHFNEANNEGQNAEIYSLIGQLHFQNGRTAEALHSFRISIQIADQAGMKEAKYRNYPLIAGIYQQLGKQELALQYLNNYVKYTEKAKEEQGKNIVAELAEEFRSKERDRKIASQAESLEKQKRIRLLTESKLENATLRSQMKTYLIIAFIIVIALVSIIALYRSRQIAIQQKRKEAEMSQILLRTQMNPHFIFNAMSIIQSYIYDNDLKTSSEFLVSFSRLIRLILENSPKEFISIATEIDILTKYLETQKLRFEKRFDYDIICPENLVLENTLIPPMIAQPFVENSIEHGELHRIENGKIIVRFSEKKGMLSIEIEDNGIGRTHAGKNKKGSDHKSMALHITQERIRIINEKQKSSGRLTIMDLNQDKKTGTKVQISLPLKKEVISSLK